eukprot:TRINITY_DN1204_c0_g1_i1.p1 TRINITY_DN1204_c0_g1~~TRINITY_DN1204_c0_g1_i1.p1  ORF type:complete len:504 (+),score=84.74 TRINITY_DN1204_c0_g1_i1:57-1568(+)
MTDRYSADFEELELLGEGGFGVVYKVKNKLDGGLYAVKMIRLSPKQHDFGMIQREILSLRSLKHDNVVRYYQSWIESRPDPPSSDSESEGESDSFTSDENDIESASKSSMLSDLGGRIGTASLSNQGSNSTATPSQDRRSEEQSPLYPDGGWSDEDDESDLHQVVPSSDLITCNTCGAKYQDWEVSFSEWELLQGGMRSYYLCQNCYMSALAMGGIDPSRVTFKLIQKPPVVPRYLFIQMEYCPRVLSEVLLDKSFWQSKSFESVMNTFFQIVDGLVHIHDSGFVHRDLKPSNIFLDTDNVVKIGDFGLSKALTQGSNTETPLLATRKRIVGLEEEKGHTSDIGTTLYQSPEISRADPKYDNRVDVFSLGVILYEMIRPFETAMERAKMLGALRNNPSDHTLWSHPLPFEIFPDEFDMESATSSLKRLVESLLSDDIHKRPKTCKIAKHKIRLTLLKAQAKAQGPASSSHKETPISPDDVSAIQYGHKQVRTCPVCSFIVFHI